MAMDSVIVKNASPALIQEVPIQMAMDSAIYRKSGVGIPMPIVLIAMGIVVTHPEHVIQIQVSLMVLKSLRELHPVRVTRMVMVFQILMNLNSAAMPLLPRFPR